MPAAHVFSYSVMCPVHAHESAQGMREPSGEPVATSDRALECSRLHAGAQRHARPAFTAFEPVEPLSADLYGNNGRELPRRAAIGRRRGDDDRACRRQLGGLAAASLAERIEEERWKQQRPFPASKVAGNWVRWTRASTNRGYVNCSAVVSQLVLGWAALLGGTHAPDWQTFWVVVRAACSRARRVHAISTVGRYRRDRPHRTVIADRT